MKRYLLAAVASVMLVGFAVADEFQLQITSIDANGSVTGIKFVKAEEVTVKLARDVRVHKGKFDPKTGRLVAVGDDLKLAGLKAALLQAQTGSVVVGGKAIGEKDILELSVRDGKPVAKLNGKDIPFATVNLLQEHLLGTVVTTSDDGVATTILLPFAGFGLVRKKANN